MTSPNTPYHAAPPLPADAALPEAPPTPRPHPTLPVDRVPERRGAVAVLSHTRREGEWILPRLFRVFAFMGNVEIDLVHALLAPGTSHIEIRCMWGNVEIVMPPDLRVEFEVDPIVASADMVRKVPSTTSPDAPQVRVTGTTFMGSVELRIIDPNAPSFLTKLKKRLAKKSSS